MAVTADINDLSRRGLADISLRLVHRLQAHLRTVTTVASHTAEPLRRVEIRLVHLNRLRQVVHAKRCVTDRASFSLRLCLYEPNAGREHETEQKHKKNSAVSDPGTQRFHS
jgi:hypothetical protein